jgi:hypothetical protein
MKKRGQIMSKSLKAGVSITDISPKKGIELAGYPHYSRNNTGIHDPLYASCIILDNVETKVAIACMDLLMISKKYVGIIRDNVEKECGIPSRNIFISCSHTHSGPLASGMIDIEAIQKGYGPDEEYVQSLIKKITNLIIDAYSHTFDAKIGIGKGICGKEKGVGGNRRDPNGVTDPDVFVIGLKDNKDDWRAFLVKYALHPTVIHEGSTLVTADYPAYIREFLAKTKPGAHLLFAQGTSGNQSTRYFRTGQNFDEARRIGYAIAEEANKVLDSMEFYSDIDLAVSSKEINIELKTLPSREEAEALCRERKKIYEELIASKASYIEIQNANLANLGAEATLAFVLNRETGKKIKLVDEELPAEIMVIKINDACIVGLPGEFFVEFGLEIKSNSPVKNTIVIELANGCLPGYVCTEEAYAIGGYETGASLLSAKAGEDFVKASLDLIKNLNK